MFPRLLRSSWAGYSNAYFSYDIYSFFVGLWKCSKQSVMLTLILLGWHFSETKWYASWKLTYCFQFSLSTLLAFWLIRCSLPTHSCCKLLTTLDYQCIYMMKVLNERDYEKYRCNINSTVYSIPCPMTLLQFCGHSIIRHDAHNALTTDIRFNSLFCLQLSPNSIYTCKVISLCFYKNGSRVQLIEMMEVFNHHIQY